MISISFEIGITLQVCHRNCFKGNGFQSKRYLHPSRLTRKLLLNRFDALSQYVRYTILIKNSMVAINDILHYTTANNIADFHVSLRNDSLEKKSADELRGPPAIQCGLYPRQPKAGSTVRVTCTPGPAWGRFVYIWRDEIDSMFICDALVFGYNASAFVYQGNINAQTLACLTFYLYTICMEYDYND